MMMSVTATIDTYRLCEHTLRCMADDMGDYHVIKSESRKQDKYAAVIEMWHVLANGINNREAADVCKEYADRLGKHYAAKGKFTQAGNYTTPYKRMFEEGIAAMMATFTEAQS